MLGLDGPDDCRQYKYFEHFDEHQPKNDKFLSLLRLITFRGDLSVFTPYLSPTVISAKTCPKAHRRFVCPAFTAENERSMLTRLRQYAQAYLTKYPDSYESDVKLLAENKTLSFNERNAIVMRSGEKKVRNGGNRG